MDGVVQCVFYDLGSDGTVSANKNTIKIIGEETDQFTQGHFVYDSKKAGAVTVSHLRFSHQPIHSPYLISDNEANFIGCHQTVFLERYPMLKKAANNAVFFINTPATPDNVWATLPHSVQQQIIEMLAARRCVWRHCENRNGGTGNFPFSCPNTIGRRFVGRQ